MPVPSQVIKVPTHQKFIQDAVSLVEQNIADADFGVPALADKMCISQQQLYRKMNSIAGISVTKFISIVRLKRAEQLLLQDPENISEVAFQVGFKDPGYFSKCFKQHFGVSPARYIEQKKNVQSPG
ncbi:MAG: helix-turn-helix domain-containing protein [Cyclobacteriaceae bacterium]